MLRLRIDKPHVLGLPKIGRPREPFQVTSPPPTHTCTHTRTHAHGSTQRPLLAPLVQLVA
jgi:hypothetical protein